jgi:Protein of unknown function (DUF2793)
MNDTPNLILPYILAAQSQKHVTHNEAIRALDALVQITALDRNLATPPGSPADGDRYIVAASPTSVWAGHAGEIAAYQDAAWLFYPPKEGWIAWVADENLAVVYDGTDWISLSAGGGGVTDHGLLTGLSDDDHAQYHNNARGDARYSPINPVTLGVNATADTTNRLALASAASLFNHAGTGGHQVKINKALAGDTASFLFQTAFSGRAELGTTGDDDFHFKVSANGTTFNEAILINRTTGACTFPNTSLAAGTVSNVATGAGLTGGPITATGTIAMANMVANTLKGNNTGFSAAPADLTVAQVKTMLNLAGANSGDQTITLSGDVGGSGTGAITATIANNAVTNAKSAQMAANTIKGNNTGATANAGDLTAAQVKTMLAISASDVSGLAAIATSGSASSLVAGTVPAAQMPAHTGDVTSTAGSVALTIAANAVTNAKAAQMAAGTFKANNTGTTANGSDITAAQARALLAIAAADVSGLGALATASSVNLSTQASGILQAAQEPAHTGDVTNSAGSLALTIAAGAVTNAKLANMAANTVKGVTSAGAPADLSMTQLTSILPDAVSSGASHARGLVPDPGATAGTTRFLREDMTWFTPPGGGGGSPGGSGGQVQFNSAGTFGGFTVSGDATLDTSTGALSLAANVVTNAKSAQMAANTIKGNNAGLTANAADLTGIQVQALLVAQPTVQTFTTSGTWTKPSGCKRVRVRSVGGGGGGGGATAATSQSCAGGGGSSGAYGEAVFDVTATASLAVTVGAAGAAGVAANGTGGIGGTTSFGGLMSCPGGSGGIGMTTGTAVTFSLGGSQASVATGSLSIASQGQGGGHGYRASGTVAKGGDGSASVFGGAQRGSNVAAAVTASASPGAGGQGAISTSLTGFAGGAGAAGIVVVEEFY